MIICAIIVIFESVYLVRASGDSSDATLEEATTITATLPEETTVLTTTRVTTTTKATTVATTTADPRKNITYTIISGKYTWEEAEDYCESHGGQLTTVHSDSEWNAMMKSVKDAKKSNSDLKYLWMGVTSIIKYDMSIDFSWVDGSSVSYIMGSSFDHWYYNESLNMYEPSGYDAYEYITEGTLTPEPYLCLWYIDDEWSLNDIPDVTDYSYYNSDNMGFIMETY